MTGNQAAPTASWAARIPSRMIVGTPTRSPGTTRPSRNGPPFPSTGRRPSSTGGDDPPISGPGDAPRRMPAGTSPEGTADGPELASMKELVGLGDADGAAVPTGRLGGAIDTVGVGTGGSVTVGSGTVGSGTVGSGTGVGVGNRTVGNGLTVGSGTLGTATGSEASGTGTIAATG
jgi:hypothetical protein